MSRRGACHAADRTVSYRRGSKIDRIISRKGFAPCPRSRSGAYFSAPDRGIPEARIMEIPGVGQTAIWRTRNAYLEGGAEYALCDVARSGKPREYDTDVEAQIPPWPARSIQREPGAGLSNCWNRRHGSRRIAVASAPVVFPARDKSTDITRQDSQHAPNAVHSVYFYEAVNHDGHSTISAKTFGRYTE